MRRPLPESAAALEAALDELTGLAPAFVAITYGAGGSTRERTRTTSSCDLSTHHCFRSRT